MEPKERKVINDDYDEIGAPLDEKFTTVLVIAFFAIIGLLFLSGYGACKLS